MDLIDRRLSDPTACLRHAWPAAASLRALTGPELTALWRSDASLHGADGGG